jgi:hypothetical protein
LGGGIIGMHHVDIVEPIVPEHVDHQLVGREIPETVEFADEMMYGYGAPG